MQRPSTLMETTIVSESSSSESVLAIVGDCLVLRGTRNLVWRFFVDGVTSHPGPCTQSDTEAHLHATVALPQLTMTLHC